MNTIPSLGILLVSATLACAAAPTVFDVRTFGAKGDGVTVNTASIQKAIDACTAAGGGQVLVAGGKFVTGTIYLKSNIDLHIDSGAVLLGSTNITDYAADTHKNMYAGEPHMDRCLLFARGATNLALTGHGTIDGQGRRENFPNPGDPAHYRPMLLRFMDCQKIRLRDLTLRNPAAWTSAWLYSRDIVVDGISIESRANSNGDGLDFDGCEDVRVSNTSFDTSDDSICLQTSRADRPCRNITIQSCVMKSHWAGIRIGLLSLGDFENVTVSNCILRDIQDAGLKIQMCEGGTMKNLVFSNLVMERVPRPVFVTFNSHRMGVDSPKELPPMQALRDLQFSHIRVDNSGLGPATPTGIVVIGSTNHPIENISFDDISVTAPGGGTAEQAAFRDVPQLAGRPEFRALGEVTPFAGFYARHVRGLTVTNLRYDAARPEARPAVLCEDAADIELSSVKVGAAFAGDSIVRVRRVEDVLIRQCRTQGTSDFFLRIEDSADDAVTATPDNRHHSAKAISISRGRAVTVVPQDREILRRLADRKARLATLPAQAQTKEGWRRLNDLEPGKPMVWINEICWNELRNEPDLACQCADPFLRGTEQELRRERYQWDHLPVDMVVENVVFCPLAIRDSGFGIDEETDIIRTDVTSDVVSRHFYLQIQTEKDLGKIRTPVVRHDEADSQSRLDLLRSLIGDLIRVEPCGIPGSWFAPWDELCRWWGPQEALTDLIERPELVHAAMDRLLNAYLARLDQWEALNLLSSNLGNHRIGSGGLGYTRQLPPKDADPAHWRAQDLWGSATAQIFSDVSPSMHEEFALEYELRWLQHWGLTYYGCCEPLHLKLEMLKRRVPSLRKISMSPKADLGRAVPQIGRNYVISHKPNPAVLATDAWNVARAEQDLRAALDRCRGGCVEVILKDISTIRYEPARLHDWAAMARRVTAEYA